MLFWCLVDPPPADGSEEGEGEYQNFSRIQKMWGVAYMTGGWCSHIALAMQDWCQIFSPGVMIFLSQYYVSGIFT